MRIGNPDLGEELAPGIAALMWGSAEEEEEEEEENVEEEWNGDDMEFISFFVSIKEKRDVDSVRERERKRVCDCEPALRFYFFILFIISSWIFLFLFIIWNMLWFVSSGISGMIHRTNIKKKKNIMASSHIFSRQN